MPLNIPRVRRGFYHIEITEDQDNKDATLDPTDKLLSYYNGKLSTALKSGDKFRITFWSKVDSNDDNDVDLEHLKRLLDILYKNQNVTFGIDATCVGKGKP